jgi:hypothetical protein
MPGSQPATDSGSGAAVSRRRSVGVASSLRDHLVRLLLLLLLLLLMLRRQQER